ncbi:MAG: hypothetical protein CMP75_03405 [Flavobacteriales bacterium]|nr:hypothetical protein [Flavobacteriales bacterium]|tara:strand:- start:792 stop:3269 length:2478 start_codon:yes stop_codon:yes gene_type:complete
MRTVNISMLLLLSSFFSFSQNIYLGAYNHIELEEDFNSKDAIFPLSTTIDNYFIVDNGDFFLNRNNINNEYALFTKESIEFSNFRVKTSFKIGPSGNSNPHIGIVLKAQRDGSGAIAIDINAKGQYRVRQLVNGQNKFLTGSNKKNGWEKSPLVKGLDKINFLDIVTENGDYEIFINHHFITAITLPEYNTGSIGLIIGAQTKARVEYFYVYSTGTDKSITYSSANNERIKELERILTEKNFTIEELRLDKESAENKLATTLESKRELEESITSSGELYMNENEKLNNKIELLESEKEKLETTISKLDRELNLLVTFKGKALSEKDNLEGKLMSLQEEEIKLKETIKELESSNSKINKNLTELTSEKTSLVDKNKKLSSDLSNAINTNTSIEETLASLKADMQEKDVFIHSLTEKENSLELENRELNSQNSSLLKEVSRLEKDVEIVNFDLLQKSDEFESINSNQMKSENKIIELNNQLSNVKTQNTELSSENTRLKREKSKLQDELNSLENIENMLATTEKDLNNQLINVKNQNTELSGKNIRLKREKSKLQGKLNSLENIENTLAATEIENNTLQSELKLLKSSNKKKEVEKNKIISNLKLTASELEKNNTHLEETLNSLENDIVKSKEINNNLESKLSEIEIENITLNNKLIEYNKVIRSLNSKNTQQSTEITELHVFLDKTQKELTNTINSLDEVTSANSALSKDFLDLKAQYEKQLAISNNFANSYRIEREKNDELQKEISFTSSSVLSNTSRSKNTIYRVQLGTFGQRMEIEGIQATEVPTQNGMFIYLSGKFKSYSEAKVRLFNAQELGYNDAFIIKF